MIAQVLCVLFLCFLISGCGNSSTECLAPTVQLYQIAEIPLMFIYFNINSSTLLPSEIQKIYLIRNWIIAHIRPDVPITLIITGISSASDVQVGQNLSKNRADAVKSILYDSCPQIQQLVTVVSKNEICDATKALDPDRCRSVKLALAYAQPANQMQEVKPKTGCYDEVFV